MFSQLSFLILVGVVSAMTPQDVKDALNLFKTPTKGGKGSYYGDNLDIHGTCRLIDPLPAYSQFKAIKMDLAMNVEQWFGSLACGMCLKVNHDVEGEFYGYVQDKCMGCGMGGLDLGVLGHGKPKQTIQAVQCPVANTPMQYRLEGDNFWLKVQIRNARVPISELSLKQKDGSWKAMKLEGYGAFTSSVSLLPSGNDLHLKMKSVNGFEVMDVLPKLNYDNKNTHTGSAQVPLDSSLPKMPGDDSKGGSVGPGPGKGGSTGTGGKGGGSTGGGSTGGKTGGGGGSGGKTTGGKGGGGGQGGKTKGPFSCEGRAGGTYGDPEDCTAFIQCAHGTLFRFKCQGNLKFDTKIMNCNHAWAAKCA